MKKIIALALTLVLVLSMSVTVFAADTLDITNTADSNGNVTISVNMQSDSQTDIYYVVVSWESMAFTYTFNGSTLTWDPQNHNYVTSDGNDGNWTNSTIDNAITVANHSNNKVSVAITIEGETDGSAEKNGVTAEITADDDTDAFTGFILEEADTAERLNNFGNADTSTFDVAVSGKPTNPTAATSFGIVVTVSTPTP